MRILLDWELTMARDVKKDKISRATKKKVVKKGAIKKKVVKPVKKKKRGDKKR